ncbi:MAG: hypothetical protein LBI38_02160 [Oscillospiraceae bacterium]|jgi:hypothetical protein|nr:hypothetical protein [Oscillospiraceae bacterium]
MKKDIIAMILFAAAVISATIYVGNETFASGIPERISSVGDISSVIENITEPVGIIEGNADKIIGEALGALARQTGGGSVE